MKTSRTFFLILVLLVTLLITSSASGGPILSKSQTIAGNQKPWSWQTEWFSSSTPEKQGMDSSALLQILDTVEKDQVNIHSLLVMRHGVMVLEAYYPPFNMNDKHSMFSATKSVLSALVGIAVAEGKIESLDEPVLNYFQEYTIANRNEKKEKITIQHLLDMTSGLESCENDYETRDLQYSLDLPGLYEPGTVFEYNSCNSVLLSAILQKTTGMTTLAYAQEKLFGPLEIQDLYWSSTLDGITQGNVGLMLTPRNMLKFGQLYMQNGVWEGKQVVPAEWIQDTEGKNLPDPNAGGYHNQWWLGGGAIGAYGYAGQVIFVFPQSDLVVVVTAQFPAEDIRTYAGGLAWSAFGAIRADDELPESPSSKVLAERIKAIAHPQAQDVPQLPKMAKMVNGKTFQLEANPLGWTTAKLTFKGKKALLSITTNGPITKQKFAIGLDGLFRRTDQRAIELSDLPVVEQRGDTNPFEFNFVVGVPIKGKVWMKGSWTGDDTFSLTVQDSRDFDREILNFRFQPPGVQIDWNSIDKNATLLTFAGDWH